MAKKQIMLVIASILVFTLFLGLTSAITLSGDSSITLNQNNLIKNFTLTTDIESNFTNSFPNIYSITDSDDNSITLTFSANGETTNVTSVTYSVTASGDIATFNFPESGSINIDFTAINVTNENLNVTKTIKFTFENMDFCEDCTNEGELEITDVNINVLNGFGDDDSYWYLLDEIEVELDVENNGAYDIRKIEVEWALYNTAGKKLMSGTEDNFKLDSGDDITTSFTFVLDENIDDFEGEDARLYVKVTGEIDDNDADELDGTDTCDSYYDEVPVNSGDDFVIVTDFKINGFDVEDSFYGPLSCGQEVTITGNLWNIGDTDQDDVTLIIYNNALGIYETIEFTEIKAFDSEVFGYTFVVPEEMEEKNYALSFEVFDDNNDLFENSENDEAKTSLFLKVEGSCVFVAPTITAVLDSEAKAGTEMIVKVTITNTGEEQMILTLEVNGFEDWATLSGVNPSAIVLKAGDSQDVMVTLKLNKDSEGEHTFEIATLLDEEVVQTGSLFVTVEKSSFNFKDLFDRVDLKLALIILINLILVIAIIVVAVKVARRK